MDTITPSVTTVTYKEAVYDLKSVPDPKSLRVTEAKAEVLGGVRIDKLVHNLALTADLIYLAYSATPAKYGDLRAQIDMLHIQFGDICGECVTKLGKIMSCSQEVTRKLGMAFGFLFQGREDAAMMILARCAADAATLADAAGELAARFDALCTIADKALSDSQVKQGDEIKLRDQLKQTKNDVIAEEAKLKTLQEQLTKLIADLKLEYDEEKGKLKTSEERAFALAITGAIMQPLGQALGGAAGAVAQIYASRAMPPAGLFPGTQPPPASQPGSTPAPTPAPNPAPPAASPENAAKLKAAEEKLEKAKLDAAEAEADEKTLQATIEVIEKKITKLPDVEKDPDKRRARQDQLDSAKGEAQRDLDAVTAKKETVKAEVKKSEDEVAAVKEAIKTLGVAISDAGKNISGMGNDYVKIAESQRARVREIFNTLIAKQDAEREILGKVKEATLRLQNLSTNIESAEVTISALFQVIAAMKQVVSILHEAREFWNNMRDACKALSAPAFMAEMKDNVAMFPDPKDRVSLFYDTDGFKLPLLGYLAKWRALEVIAAEYIEQTKGVAGKVRDDFKNLLLGDRAKAKVQELSARLLGEVANDIGKLDAERKTVQQAQQAMKAA
jgi:hypothetical protein